MDRARLERQMRDLALENAVARIDDGQDLAIGVFTMTSGGRLVTRRHDRVASPLDAVGSIQHVHPETISRMSISQPVRMSVPAQPSHPGPDSRPDSTTSIEGRVLSRRQTGPGPDIRSIVMATVGSAILIAIAMLLIFGLLPAALGAAAT